MRPRNRILGVAAMLAPLAFAACGSAESAESTGELDGAAANAEAAAPRAMVPEGARLQFRTLRALSTENDESGATFTAELTEDYYDESGALVMAAGARATGHVAESQESPGPDEPAVIAVQLDAVELLGEMRPVESTVVAADVEAGRRASDGETAAKIAVGAAAGALLGRAIGEDRKGAIIGAVAGAGAGTLLAVHTQDGHAVIPAGSTLTIVLDNALVVR